MQYLKALVIGMGILIVLGMGLLVYGFAAKTKSPVTNTDQSSPATVYGDINLGIPHDCENIGILSEDNRLIIEIGPRDNPACSKIIILDLATGNKLGTVSLNK